MGLRDAGKLLPANEWEPGKPCSLYLKCPCGEIFSSQQLEETVIHVPHITAAGTSHWADSHFLLRRLSTG